MSERAYFLYEPESDTAEIIDPGKRPQELRQYLACLATGLSDISASQNAMIEIVSQRNIDNLQIRKASALLHGDNHEKVTKDIIEAARTHRIASSDAVGDLGILNEYAWGGCHLINKDGIMLDSYLEVGGEIAADEGTDWFYGHDSPKHEVVMQLLNNGVDELHNALQFEFDPATSSMYSDRYHESLGIMKGEEYIPIVTFLSEEHPLPQLISISQKRATS